MKSIYTIAALALLATGTAAAQPKDICEANKAANAALISRAQAAQTPQARMAILKAAIDADQANAVCIADLALQMSLIGGIDPAAGPEEFGTTAGLPTTTNGNTPPAENPNQLNQPAPTGDASPAQPEVSVQ